MGNSSPKVPKLSNLDKKRTKFQNFPWPWPGWQKTGERGNARSNEGMSESRKSHEVRALNLLFILSKFFIIFLKFILKVLAPMVFTSI